MRITRALILVIAALGLAGPLAASSVPQAGKVEANGINIAYESYGRADRPTILLIAGTGMQLTDWPPAFCKDLVKHGYRVVIYDNRDAGLSTKFNAFGMPDFRAVIQAAMARKPAPLPYTLYDMADDAVKLLDALGIKKAHVVGFSMGGMIAQIMATDHPDHVLSLASVMATDGKPGLPIIANSERMSKIPPPAPDEDKNAYIARMVKTWQIIGSQTYPMTEKRIRDIVTADVERSFCPACDARQGAASLFTGMEDRRLKLNTIRVPPL